MNDQLLGVFKICLLILLYLFFARVLWAVWSEVRAPRRHAASGGTTPPGAPAATPGAMPPKPARGRGAQIGKLTIIEPRSRKGTAFGISEELTVGRSATCAICITDDTFVSTLHARVFRDDGLIWVEDLGSTNGTFHNGSRISSPEPLSRGDRIQIGNTVLEAG